MQRLHTLSRTLAHVVRLGLLSLLCCGCALPRQAAERLSATASSEDQKEATEAKATAEKPTQTPAAEVKVEQADKISAGAERAPLKSPTAAAATADHRVDPQALEEVMAQLSDMRALDPKAHDQLLADLKHVDPKLWPMLVQGFKASIEYRERKQTGAAPQVLTASSLASATPVGGARVVADNTALRAGSAVEALVRPAQEGSSPITPPAVNPVQPAETRLPQTAPPVQRVSQESAVAPADWHQPLEAAIRSLEAALAESPGPAEDDRQVYLRMLYLLAGQRDKAMRPLASHDALAQEFWSKELYSLSTYMDSQRVSDRSRRAAEAALHHWEASNRLGQQGNLLVRNLAFCTEVMSYGVYTPFDRHEFQPGQRVVLYAEVENFVSQPTPRGHRTALESSYQIFDASGHKIDEHQFPPMEEHCQNPRRDFFIAYDTLRLPAQMYDGRYTLKLTIEDAIGKKVGQSSLDFQIKANSSGQRSGR